MATYALSDLHVHSDDQPFLFTPEKELIFDRLAQEVLNTESDLIIAGDFIDFTGMECPENGHAEFFSQLFSTADRQHPLIVGALKRPDREAQIWAIGERFPKLFQSLKELAQVEKLTLIPGNHDCCFRSEQVQQIFSKQLGVAPGQIKWRQEVRVGEIVFASHGNQFDPSNQTDLNCENRGVAITSALYQALMPALAVLGVPLNTVAAIPAVRPEEVVIRGLEQVLTREATYRLVAAFVGLISRNGYFPTWQRLLLLPVSHRIPVISARLKSYLTTERLCRALPDETYLKNHVREQAERLQRTLTPKARMVVLGHTHQLDRTEHYLNLGTWIDHLTGISLTHLQSADSSLPVLKIEEDGECTLYDARDLTRGSELALCRKIY